MNEPIREPDCEVHPLAITVTGQAVTGTARASWGTVEVTMLLPFAGLSRSWSDMDWILAHDFALGGWWDGSPYPYSDEAKAEAEKLLAAMYLDCLAVRRHREEVKRECRQARQELERAAKEAAAGREALRQERLALRRRLKAGEIDSRAYQQALLGPRSREKEIEQTREKETKQVGEWFTERVWILIDRKLSLDEAEGLLAVAAGAGER